AEFFLKGVPPVQAGHGLGLFLYAFGIFAAIMLVASLRTSVAVVTALALLTAALFVLGAGNYPASTGLIRTGGWIGLALAAAAFYLALAKVCEAVYGREILPVGHLAEK
ncbi:MAG TPA: acetate uptake transporter, partial [Streptosporangiaceae bacterium]|nr:acetate uptake transporter [Streptosporangiaceae bacterium]